ncbi:hypothetical protein BD779DRAFT_1511571 [Infundibulicybe gibba]|nr:hypothetical protein BD779DRAFT_1511571 [Infundibulicybe gibba]
MASIVNASAPTFVMAMESPGGSQAVSIASFDDDAGDTDMFSEGSTNGTDVILRSFDNIDFYTHRLLLSLASPFFRDMFTLPQGSTTSQLDDDAIPTIHMGERSNAVRHFLMWCDPRCRLVCEEWGDIIGVLELAEKYEVAPLKTEMGLVMKSRWVCKTPLRVYAIAIQYRFIDLIKLAARRSLEVSLGEFPDIPEMSRISAIAFHHLLRYHHSCASVAVGVTTNLSWLLPDAKELFKRHRDSGYSNCCSTSSKFHSARAEDMGVLTWLYNHLTLAGQLLLNQPAGKTIKQLDPTSPAGWEPYKQAIACSTCSSTWRYNVTMFNSELSAEIEKRIDTVPFTLSRPASSSG